MIEIGRIVVKIAGRDAGKKAVIIDIIDNNYVLIDGETRRRRCNIDHLEPLEEKVDIKKGASHTEVKSVLKPLDIEARETKPKQNTQRPLKQRKRKEKPSVAEKKEVKKEKPVKKEPAAKPKKETKKKEAVKEEKE